MIFIPLKRVILIIFVSQQVPMCFLNANIIFQMIYFIIIIRFCIKFLFIEIYFLILIIITEVLFTILYVSNRITFLFF